MSHLLSLGAAVLAGVLGLGPARAAAESPISGSFEFRVGTYRPDIDSSAFDAGATLPYQATFAGRPNSFKLHVARALPWRLGGTFELGVGAGWWETNGFAVTAAGAATSERTGFKIVPTQLTATWRFDVLWEELSIPLVPYARASLERYNWWITGPGGKTVKTGATNGYAYGGGLALVLNVVDPMLARELDSDMGVNQTMVTLDVSQSRVDDFGAKKTFDLSDSQLTVSVGLLFVF